MAMILSSLSNEKKPCRSTSIPRFLFPSLSAIWLFLRTPELSSSFYLSQSGRKKIDKDDLKYGMASV